MIDLDGTPNKQKLGAMPQLGVPAVSKAGAAAKGVPLYQHVADVEVTHWPTLLPVPAETT